MTSKTLNGDTQHVGTDLMYHKMTS